MSGLFRKIRDKHALWYKVIVFSLTVLICVYSLPKQRDASIRYDRLKQWPYEDVKAQTDFSVKKTPAEIDAEYQQEKSRQMPYFTRNNGVWPAVKEQVGALPLAPPSMAVLQRLLEEAYNTGVYELSEKGPGNDYIFIVNGSEVKESSLSELVSVEGLKKRIAAEFPEVKDVFEKDGLLQANVAYDKDLTEQMYGDVTKENIFPYKDKVARGEVVVRKNQALNDEARNRIASYNEALAEVQPATNVYLQWLGQLLVSLLILGIMMLFLAFFRKNVFSQNTHVTFIFLVILLIVVIAGQLYKYNEQYVYAVPFCLVPILIRVFFDSRTALFNFLNVILLCSFFTTDKFQFVFVQLITGIGTIFSIADIGKRSQLFISAMVTFLFYCLSFVAYHLVNNTPAMISDFNNYIPFLISSACMLFSFPLIFLFEKLFGFISDFTMLELSDLNLPLLRELSQKVPGTFQHSLQVANIAEEACYKVGGNPLLVRVGAMYHDIGKIFNPRYFTENQIGEVSPHEELSPEESAHIIIGHVIKGIEKAREHKLPEQIIDFIRTHHGTTTTRFFLHNYKKEHAGEVVNEDLFRYPGPIPFSKETAILMMADSVEAASRSLKKYDAVAIDELVDKIIDHQIAENQFINADITFRDINQVKKIFKKRLMNMYHVRIEYPR